MLQARGEADQQVLLRYQEELQCAHARSGVQQQGGRDAQRDLAATRARAAEEARRCGGLRVAADRERRAQVGAVNGS